MEQQVNQPEVQEVSAQDILLAQLVAEQQARQQHTNWMLTASVIGRIGSMLIFIGLCIICLVAAFIIF